jgi:hypothetical protein
LRNLGIHLIDAPTTSEFILCAPRIGRTKKFINAIAFAPTVLSTGYLDHCLEKKELPSPTQQAKFRLVDKDAEKKIMYGTTLKDALTRAKQNDKKLLKDWQVFCTPKVQGGWETFKDIVEVNGGKCLLFRDKMKMTVTRRGGADESQDGDEMQKLFLVSGESREDKKLWDGFREMAAIARMEPVIVGSEWLLVIAMAQDIDLWREEWILG